jgi:hypothetical protein
MTLKNQIRIGVVAVGLVLTAVTYVTLEAPCKFDTAKVYPDLAKLQEPFRKVAIDYYVAEAGAIGVAITDAGGVEKAFLLPAPAQKGGAYGQILAGVHYVKEPGGVPVPDPEHTRRRLTDIVVRYGDRGPDADMALLALRGHPVDKLRVWVRRKME